jgi:GH24 family phage-related lysozyme (muramidase)
MTPAEVAKYPKGASIPNWQIIEWFNQDYAEAAKKVKKLKLGNQPPQVHEVLTALIFQMGLTKISTWTNTLAAIKNGEYAKAADEMMLNSKRTGPSIWSIQTPERAMRTSELMRQVQ